MQLKLRGSRAWLLLRSAGIFLNLPFETQPRSPLLQSTINNEVVAISSIWKSEIRKHRVAPVSIPGLTTTVRRVTNVNAYNSALNPTR